MQAALNLFDQIYPTSETAKQKLITLIEQYKAEKPNYVQMEQDDLWYQKAVTYSVYVDLFAGDIKGFTEKLDYLKDLGVNTIWLLPVLDSPMHDYGFDVSDYKNIRKDLIDKNSPEKADQNDFYAFIDEAHKRGIRLIFDVPLNHCSKEHEYFKKAEEGDPDYKDWFIWSDSQDKYKQCRILFKGIMESNWEYSEKAKEYYFHRFYDFQPDLNFRNPEVCLFALDILLYWQSKGIDGFRLDAIPFLWKEEGTDCENLEPVHHIIKLFRAVLDEVSKGTFLLAEACQPPKEVVKYFGQGDECHSAYHFPLMPQIYHSIAIKNCEPIKKVLSLDVTPFIPDNGVWFTFLRCHDELTLEFISDSDRKTIHKNYCHQPEWNFREGEGVSSRLIELMQGNVDKMLMAYSILMTIQGAPIIYYGDEFAKENDKRFYEKILDETGYADSRNYVRGAVDWSEVETRLNDKQSAGYQVFHGLKTMIKVRQNRIKHFVEWPKFLDLHANILAYERVNNAGERFVFIHNLKDETVSFELKIQDIDKYQELFSDTHLQSCKLALESHQFLWLKVLD